MSNTKYYLITLLCGAACMILIYAACIESESTMTEDRFQSLSDHTSVTFVMGADKQGSNYYTLATEHFLFDDQERTDIVINSCRTISDVINFLNDSKLRNTNPWSIINIVAHGNPNTGINLYLSDEGEKATPKRMLQAVLLDTLPKVNASVVDSTTKVNVWSCGIGKNPLITFSMSKFFQPDNGDNLSVYCSPHFVIFKPDTESHKISRLSLSYWPYYYKRGYRPSDSEIVQALNRSYPTDTVNWNHAIEQSIDSDLFSQEYHIPVSYTKIYDQKSERPDLTTTEQQMQWLNAQKSILEQIEDSGIPKEKFNWQVRNIIHTDSYGNKVPAVKAIGMATVVNVLRRVEV